jgi:hypothetical protein
MAAKIKAIRPLRQQSKAISEVVRIVGVVRQTVE